MKKIPYMTFLFLSFLLLNIILIRAAGQSSGDDTPPIARLVQPTEGNATSDTMPFIIIDIIEENEIRRSGLVLEIDGINVIEWEEETTVNPTNITHQVPEIFEMEEGNHTIHLEISDNMGNSAVYDWEIIVDISTGITEVRTDFFKIFLYFTSTIFFIGVLVAIIGYMYLKVKMDFNFVKFIKRNPIDPAKFIVIIPAVLGSLFTIGGIVYIYQYGMDNNFGYEYILLGGFFIVLTSFTFYSQRDKKKLDEYEGAYSQFLFEMADAMRGGIDPAKAIVELSKTDTGPLSKFLKVAAKNIKAGRPFEEAIMSIAEPTKSSSAKRYTALIAESTQIGGEIAIVVHRAAKDMDDLIKIRAEKRRQLSMQVFTIYIAFVVLVAIMYLLIDLYPELAELDFSFFVNFDLSRLAGNAAAPPPARMSFVDLKRRFFHLLVINSIGSGLIIGKLVDGKMRYGLIHSLILVAVALVVFVFFIF